MDNKHTELIKNLTNHLRSTARKLLKFDTTEEVLQYLTDSFRSELNCDFVGVVFKEGNYIVPKAWSGGSGTIRKALPLKIDQCSRKLFQKSLTYTDEAANESCLFFDLLNTESVTWFTMPIKDETATYGFCVIGYAEHTHLFEMYNIFDEFGKDVAVALSLTKSKEKEHKKMMGIKWITQNLSVHESLEKLVERIVDMTGKQTRAEFASIYLYNEEEGQFTFQTPSYGHSSMPEKIIVGEDNILKNYFPYLEKTGGYQLTVPLFIDLKMLGVLHVEKKETVFTEEELEMLHLFAEHISSMIQNFLFHENEKKQNDRLHSLLDYQQDLVTAIIEENNFDGVTSIISNIFQKAVILFDRFMRPLSNKLLSDNDIDPDMITQMASDEINKRIHKNRIFSLEDDKKRNVTVWPVNGGGDLLGYLAISIQQEEIDSLEQLTVNLVRNIVSIQFNKQKLVLNTKEQVKDSFINKLLVKQIEDKEGIIQYANLFQWNPFEPHRVAALSILDEDALKGSDTLEKKARRSLILDNLKTRISMYDKEAMMATVKDELILIVQVNELNNRKQYWSDLHENIKLWMKSEGVLCQVHIGVGGKANSIEDYYRCYRKAIETLRVVGNRFSKEGYAFFEDLGSYTLLHHLNKTSETTYFVDNYLEKIRQYSGGKNMDLFHTLRVYLEQNGHVTNTAEELFLHRSTLLYRLERIEEILGIHLNDSEQRFNLMLAYKLDDLRST